MLGVFAQSQKATIGFIVPVRPSVLMEQFSSHRTDLNEILYWGLSLKLADKFQV
jgi:hypothetical protein